MRPAWKSEKEVKELYLEGEKCDQLMMIKEGGEEEVISTWR